MPLWTEYVNESILRNLSRYSRILIEQSKGGKGKKKKTKTQQNKKGIAKEDRPPVTAGDYKLGILMTSSASY